MTRACVTYRKWLWLLIYPLKLFSSRNVVYHHLSSNLFRSLIVGVWWTGSAWPATSGSSRYNLGPLLNGPDLRRTWKCIRSTIYERRWFWVELAASISCAANGKNKSPVNVWCPRISPLNGTQCWENGCRHSFGFPSYFKASIMRDWRLETSRLIQPSRLRGTWGNVGTTGCNKFVTCCWLYRQKVYQHVPPTRYA